MVARTICVHIQLIYKTIIGCTCMCVGCVCACVCVGGGGVDVWVCDVCGWMAMGGCIIEQEHLPACCTGVNGTSVEVLQCIMFS